MNFAERFASHPLSAVSACIVWIPLAVWIVSVIGWMVTGEVEPLFGFVTLIVGLGLGIVTAFPPDPALSPFIFVAVIVTTVLFPFVRAAVNRHALAAIDIEQMEKYAEALRMKPDNVGAMVKLAELLYKRGFPGQAIALAEKALPSMPPNLFRPEHNMVSAWKMMATSPDMFRPVPCLRCHNPTPPGQLQCSHCGYETVLEMAKGRWLSKGIASQLMAVWVGILIVVVGLPLSVRLTKDFPVLALVLIAFQLAIGVFVVLKTFLKGGRHEAT